jgi:hypothetical protein
VILMQREKAKALIRQKVEAEIETVYAQTNERLYKKVFLSDQPVTNLSAVRTVRGDIPVPTGNGSNEPDAVWVAFIDDLPEANWGHPCRYVFVGDGGVLSEVSRTEPPSQKNPFQFDEIA